MPLIKNLSEAKYPPIVYKYRDWTDKWNKRFITEREVFMAPPNSFNDPLDCKNMVRYDKMSPEQKDIWFLYMLKQKYPNYNRSQIRKELAIVGKGHRINNPRKVTEFNEEVFVEVCKRIGVLSLTANPENEQLWDKYANDGQGFCIGYHSDLLFPLFGGGGVVNYVDELPIILPEPIMSFDDEIEMNIFTKMQEWELEEEYRGINFRYEGTSIEDRQIKVPVKAFHSVILGPNMSVNDKEEIKSEITNSLGSDITIIEK